MHATDNICQLAARFEEHREAYRASKRTCANKMVSLVERMLELHKQSDVVGSPQDKERVGREIESTDRAIDRLVYELYGLSKEEINI